MTQVHKLEERAYESGILCKGHHDEFAKQKGVIAREANIPAHVLYLSMLDICDDATAGYIRNIRIQTENSCYGFNFYGPVTNFSVQDRMMRMAAACLRNYISAKVMTVQEVISALKVDEIPSATVLFIPNFHFGQSNAGKVPQWQVSLLLGILYQRQKEGLQTVTYVSDMDAMAQEYGPSIATHIADNFLQNPA